MDRLSSLDAEFLHLEDVNSHMHIAGICTFGDPAPDLEEFEALVASKIHRIPRYRQRVRSVPLELGRPVWVDDPHFRLAYHVRHTALPAPGGDAELCRLMGRLMSQPLDRERPLWESWLVHGLSDNRWAIVFKVHHCMVDGVSGVGLLEQLLDLEADTALGEPEPWEPTPEPSGTTKVLDAWRAGLDDAGRWVARSAGALTDPATAARQLGSLAKGSWNLASRLVYTPPSSIEGAVGPLRVGCHSASVLSVV